MTHRNPPIRIRRTPNGWAVDRTGDTTMTPVVAPTWAQALELGNALAGPVLDLRDRVRCSA